MLNLLFDILSGKNNDKPFLFFKPPKKNKVDESRVPSLSLRQFPLP